MDILRWLDLDTNTLALLIGGLVVVLIVTVMALRSLLSSRLVVIAGGVLAVGAIAPGVLSALGNLLGSLMSSLIPLIMIVLGGLVALLVYLNRNPELREWLRPLLPNRQISAEPPTCVETPPVQYSIDAPRQPVLPPASTAPRPAAQARPIRRRHYLPGMEDWK